MTTRDTSRRLPDPCPRNDSHQAIRTIHRQAGILCISEKPIHTLLQHQCANGCGAPRGWEYHGPGKHFQHGPGECRDREILYQMERTKYEEKAFNETGGILLANLIVGAAAHIVTSLIASEFWSPAHAAVLGIALTGLVTTTAIRIRKVIREYPKPPGGREARTT